ncbi:EscU/YscU/HrcU family type III secretion system export apparatus switch protein [Fodinicurvata fenggangensis]|uniref:EscU/YscU/HrcU family type III secretion system export apparatus switch protein n=1 Tax=Fodinicurvata fenggangensis TaxID=1121830 RepID=UPI00068DA88C|nr:EscU/YscU/HrcU family type III secretion system export apparatus switch protein [Fodinicurvata fenggangensis]
MTRSSSDNPDYDPTSRPGGQRTLAVALEGEAADTTRVVARGEGVLAEQILSLAFSHNVKVRQDAALAEILATLEPDSEIPPIALAAVAEILTRLYQADRSLGQTAASPYGRTSQGQD